MSTNKKYYLEATKEFESGQRDEALWAKVLVITNGDEEKARYLYIDKRAQALNVMNINDFIKHVILSLRNLKVAATLCSLFLLFVYWSLYDWYVNDSSWEPRKLDPDQLFFYSISYIFLLIFLVFISYFQNIPKIDGIPNPDRNIYKSYVLYNIYTIIIIVIAISYGKDIFRYFFL